MTAPSIERKMTSVPNAAKVLGISRGYAYQLANSGELPGVRKIGTRFVVSIKELNAYIDGEGAA